MQEREDLLKIIITCVLMTLCILPPIILVMKRSGRTWLRQGVEGDNQRLDLSEIWEVLFMFMALGCFFTMIYMIVMKTMFGIQYEVFEYGLVFSGTLGSNTASAFIIWIKQKHAK